MSAELDAPATERQAPASNGVSILQRRVSASTLAVMLATLGSMVLGFAREVVNAKYFGESWQLDTFLVAAIIPTLVFGVFNGALVSALVPIFSGYFAEERPEEAWRLSSTVINGLLIVLSFCAAAGWLAAPFIVHLFNFPPPQAGVAVRMTRILMPTIIATSIAGVIQALLNAQHRFRAASLQGFVLNLVTIAGVLILFRQYEIYALVFATAAGLAAQLLVQLPNYLSRCKYQAVLDLRHPGLTTLSMILGPIVVGSAVGQVNLLFDKYFASTLEAGNIATMQYATKVVGFPQQLFATAIATVIFPLLAAQFVTDDRKSLRETASTGLRMTALITIPAAAGLIALAQPIISVFFERGAFTTGDVIRTAGAMQFYALGLLGIAGSIVLTRCFFAMRDSRTPVAIAAGVMVLNVICSALSVRAFGVNGLAASNSLSSIVEAAVLLALLERQIGMVDSQLVGSSMLRIATASLIMGIVARFTLTLLWHDAGSLWQHTATLVAAIVTGGVVFAVVGTKLRVRELAMLLAMAADFVKRRAASAAQS
ncbi:MAG: murein biosynthesis integral membrane protein MurJ [Candidatus Eremiobacteraeota bacterium]|nr:murein biosynthesis integral membrane protein MurJ [Candidatus Eremiobacteraeota bacterium]MBC5828331.1 murein biosynthesis integral membrane protein MurJ [Candidatus Eremiobacteraeota bacterium]